MTVAILPSSRPAPRRDPARASSGAGVQALSRDEMWTAFARADRRYDGRFVAGVRTTGIFCRPSCTCRKPRPERVIFFRTPRLASGAGFRPCKRCRPELAGGVAEAERRMAERALAILRARHAERITLAEVARAVAVSPSHFARRFRAALGVPPMRALADIRAAHAEALLAANGRSILEIAHACGFGGPAALVRAFRRRLGETPAAWRARRRKGGTK